MSSSALSDQVALVTGGGTGIGLACAEALLRDGASVVLAARNVERLESSAAELRARFGDERVHVVGCDVTDEESVAAACAFADDADGEFTIVVANAGVGSLAPFHQTTVEDWHSVMNTNLTGAFLTMKHAAGPLVANGGGSIVAVSSIAAVETHRFMTPYCVSKAGLDMLVKQVADELGHCGVRSNSVRPGLVNTEMTAQFLATPEIVDDYVAQMPVGRTGVPGDVAALVRFLAGPESSWITGECVSVDGGHHLRRGPNLDGPMAMMYPGGLAPDGPSET